MSLLTLLARQPTNAKTLVGLDAPGSLKVGTANVDKMYVGTTQIWPTLPSLAVIASTSNAVVSFTNAITINKPTGTASGDLLIAKVSLQGGTTAWTTLAGWIAGPVDSGTALFYKSAGGSEPASYTFTNPSAFNNIIGQIIRVTGASTVIASGVKGGTSATTVVLPSISPASACTLINIVDIIFAAATTWTPPVGTTEVYDVVTTSSGQNGNAGSADLLVTGGATGTRTWTATQSGTTFGAIIAVL